MFVAGQSNIKKEERYSITKFIKGSRIYYEHLSNLKLSSANGRVAVFLNVEKQNKDLDGLETEIKNLPNLCLNYYKKCLHHINNYKHNNNGILL